MNRYYILILCLLVSAFPLQSQDASKTEFADSKEVSHAFYILSNLGNVPISKAEAMIREVNQRSQNEKEATLLVIGNILTEDGFPSDDDKRNQEKARLRKLMQAWDGFNGNIVLTPGKNEWKKDAPESIDELESFLQDNSKAEFWPDDGCPLERQDINDEVVLELVDSQWFLEDWDDHPYINGKCEHKTRDQFLAEFKDDIKDSQGKTVVVAVYQPVISNTNINVIDRMGGFTPQSFQNDKNRSLRGQMKTIASQFEDVIFVSGKDRNLQYLQDNEMPQIISGAIGKTEGARARKDDRFASEKNGYARLRIFKDGSSEVDYYALDEAASDPIFSRGIQRQRLRPNEVSYPDTVTARTWESSIYTSKETDKTSFYESLWGDHYRDIYSKKIEAPVLNIKALPNNVRPISEGGGTQSRSLRLIDDNEHEYTLRALRKSAVQFIQASAMSEHYVEEYLRNTIAERILSDFYTTSHPYAQFAMPELLQSVDVLHANPKVYYVSKQEGLGIYNEDYGNALFMLEEHVGDENKSFETFGQPDDIISTSDLRLELRESKDAFVDQSSYIRARLIDQLTGNWDRHQDQWRWAEFETEDGRKRYETIPRDWDQVFPKYDGPIIGMLKYAFPLLRKMQTYDSDIRDIKWFNISGYPLDKTFITTAEWDDWKAEVDYLQKNLTDEAIDKAFSTLPEAAQDSSIVKIKKNLLARRDQLEDIARRYYDYLAQFEVVTGTSEDDEFIIERKPAGITEISILRKKDADLKKLDTVFKHSYDAERTREIWVYGLDGNDTFKTRGDGKNRIKIKVMGGEEEDTYDFANTRKIKLYDYESKENTITNSKSKKWLVDSYEINNYDYHKRKYTSNVILPSIGYDGDTGFRLGLQNRFRTYGLANNPFSTEHIVGAQYFFATSGFAVEYTPEFAHVFYQWNLGFDLRFASPNFTMNFFGEGNGSDYDRDGTDRDFNRVRIGQWSVSPYMVRTSGGSRFLVRTKIESNEVSDDGGRFIGQGFTADDDVFDRQDYVTGELGYNYLNQNNPAYPSRKFEFDAAVGYTANIDGNDNRFGYLKPSLALTYPLHPSGIAVLATKVAGQTLFGDNYEFYHGATLGGNTSLRAYRNERFNGKTAFYQSTDLRVGLTRFRTNFIPLQIGVSAGFDYGRVWADNDTSERWHNGYGGSVWINGFSFLTGNFGLYYGDDGGRFLFSLGFTF